MKQGDTVWTPRFLNVTIEKIFETREEAAAEGYTEPTHYHGDNYEVVGKSLDVYNMIFAAYKANR